MMQLGNNPQPTPKRSGDMVFWIVICVVIVFWAVYYIIPPLLNNIGSTGSSSGSSSGGSPPGPTPISQSITLLSSGTVESLNPGHFYCITFSAPSGASAVSLSGSYSSNNNVEVGVMTATQYGAFTQNSAVISSGCWYSGDNGGTTINFIPYSGTSYYLVIYDANIITSDTITVVNSITVTYTTLS